MHLVAGVVGRAEFEAAEPAFHEQIRFVDLVGLGVGLELGAEAQAQAVGQRHPPVEMDLGIGRDIELGCLARGAVDARGDIVLIDV